MSTQLHDEINEMLQGHNIHLIKEEVVEHHEDKQVPSTIEDMNRELKAGPGEIHEFLPAEDHTDPLLEQFLDFEKMKNEGGKE